MIFYLYISQNTIYFFCVNISIDYDYSDVNLVTKALKMNMQLLANQSH